MNERNERSGAWFVYVLAAVGIAAFFGALGVYAFYFRTWNVVRDPELWGFFGDYLAGAAGPLIAFLAFIALLRTIVQNERELRLSREALEQNNEISSGRAKREQLESQKADIYRIIQPLTSEIEVALRRTLAVPASIEMPDGRVIRYGATTYAVHDLRGDPALVENRHVIASKNGEALHAIGEQMSELERYLRAYDRLAGDDFFTSYFKSKYRWLVTLLAEMNQLSPERRQDIREFFHSGVDVLTSAERSITGEAGEMWDLDLAADRKRAKRFAGAYRRAKDTSRGGPVVLSVIPDDEIRELPYVSVHTYPKPNDPKVRLANISWAYTSAPPGGVPPTSDAAEAAPMSHDTAMKLGRVIAERHGFPRLYWKMDPDIPSDGGS